MTTTELVPNHLDVTRLALASFLARYGEPTLTAYTIDLRAFLGLVPAVRRPGTTAHPRRARDVPAAPGGPRLRRRHHRAPLWHRRHLLQVRGDRRRDSGQPRPTRSPDRRWPGRGRSAPCCTRWSSLPCSLRPAAPVPTTTPWSACWACSACGCPRPARPTSPTSGTSPVTSCCTSWARAPSPRTSHSDPGPAGGPGGDRRPRDRADPAHPHRPPNGPGWSQPRAHPGRPRGWHHPPDQPARTAQDVLHHRLGRRHRYPRHAVRHAPRRPANDSALRHGPSEPRPPRRARGCGLPRWHEQRLRVRPPIKINEPSWH